MDLAAEVATLVEIYIKLFGEVTICFDCAELNYW